MVSVNRPIISVYKKIIIKVVVPLTTLIKQSRTVISVYKCYIDYYVTVHI
jgi:hypothetical protein